MLSNLNQSQQSNMITNYAAVLENRKARATDYLIRRGFEIVNQNGQRIATNRAVNEEQICSIRYNEVFIGKLPRDLFEDELFPHLQQVGGTIVKIRYMMDFSGSNRGFCFVKFASVCDAIRAIQLLDGKTLRPKSSPIGVKISFDNKCLFFGNLPLRCTAQQLIRSLRKVEVNGIVSARMADEPQTGMVANGFPKHAIYQTRVQVPSYGGAQYQGHLLRQPQVGRYGYVYFESHDAATKARRLLMPSDVKIMGRRITVDWAKSEIPAVIADLQNSAFNPVVAQHPFQQMTLLSQKPPIDNEFFTHWSPRALCH